MRDPNSVKKLDKNRLNRRLRKNNNNLVISGLGVIFFGLWSILKIVEELLLGRVKLTDFFDETDSNLANGEIYVVIILAVLFLIIFYIHYFIGKSSIIVGRGRGKRRLYILFAFLYLLVNIASLKQYFSTEITASNADYTIASFLVDIAFCVALIDMIVSSFNVMFIKKRLEEFK